MAIKKFIRYSYKRSEQYNPNVNFIIGDDNKYYWDLWTIKYIKLFNKIEIPYHFKYGWNKIFQKLLSKK